MGELGLGLDEHRSRSGYTVRVGLRRLVRSKLLIGKIKGLS